MVKTLIFEPMMGGHFTNYLETLMEFALSVPHEAARDIVFAINSEHLHDERFGDQIARFAGPLQVDDSLPRVAHSPAFRMSRRYFTELKQIWDSLIEAIERHQPDHVVMPSADHVTLAASLFHDARSKRVLGRTQSVGVLHQGYIGTETGLKTRVKSAIYRRAWKTAPWDRLMTVNPVLIEGVRAAELKIDLQLCPDPVPELPPISKDAACHQLGLDPRNRHIAFIGSVRERAALPALVNGFAAAKFDRNVKLLVAGAVEHPPFRAFLDDAAMRPDLADHLIVMDRFLSFAELNAAYHACDVAAPLYRTSHALSANLLKAIRAHKPVLVNARGYSGFMSDRFAVGQSCDPDDAVAVGEGLRQLLCRKKLHQDDQIWVDQLMAFHAPRNFAKTLLPWVDGTGIAVIDGAELFGWKQER